ncbi:MAG: PKD domain-containing protein, partial [Bacteroidota bacterium]|nr:PKD domain-containing protein [Bacteroidota bacterium]
PTPTVNSVSAITACNNTAVTLPAFTSPVAGAAFSWTNDNTAIGLGAAGNGDIPSFTATNTSNAPALAHITVTPSANGCTGTPTSFTITVNPLPIANFTASITQSCDPFVLDSTIIKPSIYQTRIKEYQWYVNDSLIGSSTAFPGFTIGSNYDSIILTLKTTSLYGCTADSISQIFYVSHHPNPSFNLSDSIGCGPLKISFTNTTARTSLYNYVWSFGNGATSTSAQPSAIEYAPSTLGYDTTYTVRLTAFNVCDTISISKNITVKRKAQLNLSAFPTSGCSPMKVNFINNSTGDSSTVYHLVFGDGADSTINANSSVLHIYHTGSTIVFPATLSATNSCGTSSMSIPIHETANSIKVNIVTKDSFVCSPSSSLTLYNQTIGGYQYQWDFGDGSAPVTTGFVDSITHTYSQKGDYTISIGISNNCSDTSMLRNFHIYASPVTKFAAASQDICIGDSVHFLNQSDSALYSWNFGDGQSSSQTNPSHAYTAAGNYTAVLQSTIQYAHGVCTTSYTQPVAIIAKRQGLMWQSDTAGKCLPFKVTFVNRSTPAKTTTWNISDGSTVYGDTITHTFTKNGRYIIIMQSLTVGGCTFVDTGYVTVTAPLGTFNYKNGYTCDNAPIRFDAITVNVDTVQWNFGDGDSLITNQKTVYHAYNKAGIYIPSVQWLSSKGCTSTIPGTDTIKIERIKADFNFSVKNDCGQTNYTFKDSSNSFFGINERLWTLGNAPLSNQPTAAKTFTTEGNQNIQLKVTGISGCTDQVTANFNVHVYQFPQARIESVSEACKTALLQLNSEVISRDSIAYRLWILGNGSVSKDSVAQAFYYSAGNYIVKFTTSTVNSCFDSAYKQITIHPTPKIRVTSPTNLCKGGSMLLSATGAYTYIWKDDKNNIICNNCSSVLVAPSTTTKYKVIGVNQYGCSDINNTVVSIIQPFSMTASANDTICIGQEKKLFASGAASYSWYPADGLISTTTPTTIASPTATTTYRVIGKDAYNCFADTASITLVVGKPTPISLGTDSVLQAGVVYNFKAIPAVNDIKQWLWSGSNNLSCYTCATPQAKIVYDECISCSATNIYGCTTNDTVCLKTFCPTAEIFVPNVFTPDGDGVNDKLIVQGKGIKLVKSFRIFNRWGELIFERTNFSPGDPSYAWDGKIRGKDASPDVFVYVCEVICEKGYPSIFKGNVAILK